VEKFELTWIGPLPCDQGSGRSPKHAYKQALRSHFHHHFVEWLKGNRLVFLPSSPEQFVPGEFKNGKIVCRKEDFAPVSMKHDLWQPCVVLGGQQYVPLLRCGQLLFCDLEIKILARPSESIRRDTDNRVKVLLDALRIPQSEDEVADSSIHPPNPCYCLLEDDGGDLVGQVCSVTRPLLSPPMPGKESEVEVHISGTVHRRG